MRSHIIMFTALQFVVAEQTIGAGPTITPKEIEEAWVGKSAVGTNAGNLPMTLKLLSDGTASLTYGKNYDTGVWRLSEDGFCAKWKAIRAGEERCFTVRREGNLLVILNPDGSINSVFPDTK